MKSFGIFDKSLKSKIGFAQASDIEDIPNSPGVYAWYLPMKGDDSGGLLAYLKSLQSNSERTRPATEVSGSGRQHSFKISSNPASFKLDSPPILKLDETLDNPGVQSLARLVSFLSYLSEPIYIGMTKGSEGLQGRLKQHLQTPKLFDTNPAWNGSFNSRIATILNDPTILQKCLIAFIPIEIDELGEEAPRLIEHIVIKTICPALSRRG